MKSKNFLAVIVILIVIQLNPSCKKDLSCENCQESNKPPFAIAGPDQVITLPTDSVLLDGSASNDPDGTISEWLWKRISGPALFTIVNASNKKTAATNLTNGIYLFELNITDNAGLSAKDTIQVIVSDPSSSNRPPVANAGTDQTITSPANSVAVNGSGSIDPENNIVSYEWTKILGPLSNIIINPGAIETQIASLVPGTYQFELKVTDGGGLVSKDTLQIMVNDLPPPPPSACSQCKIVFVSDRDGNHEIYSCNADGSNIQRLTNNVAIDDQPAWSPDGTRIAFVSDRTGKFELYVMNADGSNVVRKTFAENFAQNPAWSPDGTKVAYSSPNNGSCNVWVIDVTSGSPSLLFEAPGYDDHPAWSPDGTKIALVSDWAAYDFVYDVYTINANGAGFTALTGNIFDHFNYLHPSWSPNGNKLAIAISETIGIDQYNTQVGIMNPDGSGLTAIISGAAPGTKTAWSPDGNRIAYTSLFGSRLDVSWVSADGVSGGTIVTNAWNADW